MKQFIKIGLVGGGVYIEPLSELHNILDEIKEADVGTECHIRRIEMTQEDYNKLPEFTGH